MAKEEWFTQLFERLGKSILRTSFHLKQKDKDYIISFFVIGKFAECVAIKIQGDFKGLGIPN